MGVLRLGYGSEFHLLRYLGNHRGVLNRAIQTLMPDVKRIEWLDFPFAPKAEHGDREFKGVEFLPEDDPVRKAWSNFWPAGHAWGKGNPPNWDAVGHTLGRVLSWSSRLSPPDIHRKTSALSDVENQRLNE
ncbi:hypothetical protein HED60_05660 [Planctomycetales bacterium ZRK34]|nr:hypothetical protein HED60_05660 [Planctomycetales bacterium ZRK34]